jgi:hypothetical protein
MFDVFCPRHQRQVLLGARSIEHLAHTGTGIELHFRCHCGHEGVLRFQTSDDSALAA